MSGIPRVVYDAPGVAGDSISDEVEILAQAMTSLLLVFAGEAGVAGGIGVEDGDEFSRRQTPFCTGRPVGIGAFAKYYSQSIWAASQRQE